MTAKTRADFHAEGQRAARMNNTQNAMPVFGKGSSWQAKAFAEGWHEVRDTLKLKEVLATDAAYNRGVSARKSNDLKAHDVPMTDTDRASFMRGWNSVEADDDKLLADLGVDMPAVEATLVTENIAPVTSPVVKHHTVTVDPVMPMKAVPPKVVLSHINRLHMSIATTTDEARRQRLLRSINRCIMRWNRKLSA